ncbi:MAG TPA: hypothetical protein VHF23_02890 [Gaiellaceae bacterium]|nr:hypothetical protein [Gaiellaceae bacterium]
MQATSQDTAADSIFPFVANVIELGAGESRTLLRVRAVGTLRVRCSKEGGVAVALTAADVLPTAAVTVSSDVHGVLRRTVQPNERIRLAATRRRNFQTWQVAPFAKTASVTTIWIAVGESAGKPFYACGASAHAATTRAR